MNEKDWLANRDPQAMLNLVGNTACRKLRLFAVACCRSVGELTTDKRIDQVTRVLERIAEGLVILQEQALSESLLRACLPANPGPQRDAIAAVWRAFRAEDAWTCARNTSRVAVNAMELLAGIAARDAERERQSGFLRDIFGNPFRPLVPRKDIPLWQKQFAGWLAWQDHTVVRLAQAVYDEHAFDRVPILADALEEAGCSSPDLLTHCRETGEHVLGCWALDLLLGKT